MSEKSITEIISEFKEESHQVAQNSQELKTVSSDIKNMILSFEETLQEENRRTEQKNAVLMESFDEFFHKFKQVEVNAELSVDNKNSILSLEKRLKLFNWSIYSFIGAGILRLLILIAAGNLATQFYLKSVQSKSEVKAEIFAEMEKEGKGIYDKKEVETLLRDIKIVNEWIKKNPDDSEKLLQYMDGKLSK
jgi:hypothetical protein